MANKISKFKKRDNDEDNKPKQQTCKAAGCPMFGTRSLSLTGSDEWWCRFHFGAETSDFATITERLRQSRFFVEHIQRLKKATSQQITNREPYLFTYQRNSEFSAREGETYGKYVLRLESALARYISHDLSQEKITETKGLVESLVDYVGI